ncbi:hypothetical protein B0J17DRAFT_681618 [Rhizoctonia solani]|nr:hypothetical protein B0J17DRAFT_681618 [Rhizoctonia solani]
MCLSPILHHLLTRGIHSNAGLTEFISSERAFSSSKLTCTRERNNISAEHMEHLQVLKHSLHRRRANHDNNQTLDFMAHVVDPDGEDLVE